MSRRAGVLRHHVVPGAPETLRLNIAAGQVPVTFDSSSDAREVAWFLAPPVSLEATCAREPVAAALGLSPEDIDTRAPVQPQPELSLRIEQGFEVRRPSLVLLRARMAGASREVRVGGGVIPVVRGELL